MDNIKINCIRKHCVVIDNFNIKWKYLNTDSFKSEKENIVIQRIRETLASVKDRLNGLLKFAVNIDFISIYPNAERTIPVSKISYTLILASQ